MGSLSFLLGSPNGIFPLAIGTASLSLAILYRKWLRKGFLTNPRAVRVCAHMRPRGLQYTVAFRILALGHRYSVQVYVRIKIAIALPKLLR